MGIENLVGTDKYIQHLVKTNPVGSTDLVHTLDEHLQGIKNVLQNQFPSLGAVAVAVTAAELNVLSGWDSLTNVGKFTAIKNTQSQAITTGVETILSFDQEEKDDLSAWDIGNPTQLVVPTLVSNVLIGAFAQFQHSGAQGSSFQVRMTKNGATIDYWPSTLTRTTNAAVSPVSMQWGPIPVTAVAGDYFEVRVIHDIGSNNDVINFKAFMAVIR